MASDLGVMFKKADSAAKSFVPRCVSHLVDHPAMGATNIEEL